ncbi:hypothetical protein E4U56_001926 [Claviceps arundinis]|uniref:Uncharacterized protein n=1 Tax=Claviceps arundinis TaxID=1623583 RepID=A0A9P7MRS7_9HYPO|nr:hypothetical protein E4U56_001926 [Claviceps arundinis]
MSPRTIFQVLSAVSPTVVLSAVIINHIRRLLVPFLGHFLFPHAIATMKLARSSPHLLLQETCSFSWTSLCTWLLSTYALHMARQAFLLRALSHEPEHAPRSRYPPQKQRKQSKGRVLCRVAFLVLEMTHVETVYVATCWAASYLYALLCSGTLGVAILAKGWPCSVVPLALLGNWTRLRLIPFARDTRDAVLLGGAGKRGEWASRALVHGLVWGATVQMVRFSNRLFLVLELSDMFVTWGWMVLGLAGCLVGWDRVC